ncbi:malate dehydrogenase (quinone) [Celerinatantimonas sp. YJH-8]|uniref:malate dehydrogenase (quinone) n=1 Tax=Celerinatantimonas sp. YJH-8 TaxID=3228714 RepID=UPI0038CB05EE
MSNEAASAQSVDEAHKPTVQQAVDVVLIGGGIMSATLGSFFQQLQPDWSIEMFERLDQVANESSNGWNNAGTGHSALAELNYTPKRSDGSIDISKAIDIDEQFQVSRQFWAYLVKSGFIRDPNTFINSVPHMSFVWGADNVEFLRQRYQTMQQCPLFHGMDFSDDPETIRAWTPLLMQGRDPSEPVAATRTVIGTDVNFGALTHQMIDCLREHSQFSLSLRHEVRALKKTQDGDWQLTVLNLASGQSRTLRAKYVFIGAGGASLSLLQKSGIPQARQYGGFPVGGQFLVTENQELVAAHQAKVYGKAPVGAPPMSVPHLDTRVIDGKRMLLFGPFASFSSKFLKNGSLMDLFKTLNSSNIKPMIQVGLSNFGLIKYLISQLCQRDADRFKALRQFFPEINPKDWSLWQAGQRVQIIKKEPGGKGQLRFGTELVSADDGSLTALLGASPGASTSASIMLRLLETCFAEKMATPAWQNKIRQMVPSYGVELHCNEALNEQELRSTSEILQLSHHLSSDSVAQPVNEAEFPQPESVLHVAG